MLRDMEDTFVKRHLNTLENSTEINLRYTVCYYNHDVKYRIVCVSWISKYEMKHCLPKKMNAINKL